MDESSISAPSPPTPLPQTSLGERGEGSKGGVCRSQERIGFLRLRRVATEAAKRRGARAGVEQSRQRLIFDAALMGRQHGFVGRVIKGRIGGKTEGICLRSVDAVAARKNHSVSPLPQTSLGERGEGSKGGVCRSQERIGFLRLRRVATEAAGRHGACCRG